jgi:hypothetical protein
MNFGVFFNLKRFFWGVKMAFLRKRYLNGPRQKLLPQIRSAGYWRPPNNIEHVREWIFIESSEYMSTFFKVVDHRVTALGQKSKW